MIRLLASFIVLLCASACPGASLTGFRHITVDDGLPRNGVLAILPSRLGPVYVGTWDGLFVLNGTSVCEIMFTPSSATPVCTVNALAEDTANILWIATSEGMMKYDPATGRCTTADHAESNRIFPPAAERLAGFRNVPDGISHIITDTRGRTFAATAAGDLYEAGADSTLRKVYHTPGGISAMTEYNGQLLMGGRKGLTAYDAAGGCGEPLEIDYSDPAGINDRNITALAVDRENGLWVGTFYGGINYLSPSAGLFTDSEGVNSRLCGHVVSGIARDGRGRMWYGLEDGGVSCFDPVSNRVTNFRPDSLSAPGYRPATTNVQTIFADDMTLYVGTALYGMDILDLHTMQCRRLTGGADSGTGLPPSVYAFARDSIGQIWIGTMSGLFVYSPPTGRLRSVDHVPKAIFHNLTVDREGIVWAASQGAGLFSFSPVYGKRHYELPSDMVMSVCLADSIVYVGTEGDGLFALNPRDGRSESIPVAESLSERLMVFSIVADDSGSIWFSTNKGLMRYTPADGRRAEQFTTADGLPSNQFKINSKLLMPDGRIMMGSVSGVCSFNPRDIPRSETAPAVFLTDLLIDSRPVRADSSIMVAESVEVPFGRGIEFRFASSSHADPAKNVFEYMLEPHDDRWQTADRRNPSAAYGDLPAGDYIFRLRTAGGSGIMSAERRVRLTVCRPLRAMSATGLLVMAFGIAAVAAGGIFFFIRRRRRLRQAGMAGPPTAGPAAYASPDVEFMKHLNEIIDTHIDNSALTVDSLASELAMGRSSFFAKVKELTGQTPNDYLRSVRLSRAAELLAGENMRINEVAYRVGFASPSYFARRFAERYGVSPAKFVAESGLKNHKLS